MNMTEQQIDTGDIVFHRPTAETWIVACVQGNNLSYCGWPEGMADLSDCELKEKTTPEKRDQLLKELAGKSGEKENDHRVRYARWRLTQQSA